MNTKILKSPFLNDIMKKRALRILGILLFLIGTVFAFNTFSGITGFSIFEGVGPGISSIISLVFIAVGIVLMSASVWWDKYRVGLVIREYEHGELNLVQAALKINDGLYPEGLKITGVEYHGGTKETIRTNENFIPVKFDDEEKARDLALALYEIAVINDRNNTRNCELHISKAASSKHHKEGLLDIIKDFEHKYKEELDAAKSAA